MYDADIDEDDNWRIIRVRLYEMGHEFDEIDGLRMGDLGDILGYWSGKSKGEEKMRKRAQQKTARRNSSTGGRGRRRR